jgi:hypothetical protein
MVLELGFGFRIRVPETPEYFLSLGGVHPFG